MRPWPGRDSAEKLRHWPTICHVAEHVAGNDALDALLVVGSFAKDRADEASDLDLMIAVAEGRFDDAWEQRTALQTPDALVAWDFRPDSERPLGSRKFLTREVVKVEIGMSDARAAGARLAEPFFVLVGDDEAADRYERLEPIPDDALEEYAQKLREEGLVPEVEMRYGDLMRAIRTMLAEAEERKPPQV
jgi:hypothetical protein